jgi:Ca2+-binding RTX toxin-like protein
VETLVLWGDALNATGNSLNNVLTGNAGANWLDGAGGADTLTGGEGNDSYTVDVAGDAVVETGGNGTDAVYASVSYTLAGNVEHLHLTGSANINGTGNADVNEIWGNSGHNILNGGSAADHLWGGAGDDTYYVDNTGDMVHEDHLNGTDTVNASVTYSFFGRAAEILNLTGTGNISGTGNSLVNTITGNIGNNTLDGAGGNDWLTGGLGADIFLFQTGSGQDTITDFSGLQNDWINVHAYANGNVNEAWVTQSGADVLITLGSGNWVKVEDASRADVLSHIVW